MRTSVHTGRTAFTLMEVLAALTIGMLIVMSAGGATRALTTAREKVDRRSEQSAEARRGLEAIVGALRNVRRDTSEADKPVVIGERGADEGDRINLLVVGDRRSRPDGAESDTYEIAFFLQSAPGGRAMPSLMCRRDHALDDRIEEGGMATLVAENIIGLSFAYEAGGKWYDQWPVTELQPPQAVRVTVAAAGRPTGRQPSPEVFSLSTVVALHAAPRPLSSPGKTGGEQSGERSRS